MLGLRIAVFPNASVVPPAQLLNVRSFVAAECPAKEGGGRGRGEP